MQVVELKPEWPKGYSRLGAANQGLGNWDDAISAYKQGNAMQTWSLRVDLQLHLLF